MDSSETTHQILERKRFLVSADGDNFSFDKEFTASDSVPAKLNYVW
jgi:hypothetical protein